MHALLPPSETKRDGGVEGSVLDLGLLGFAQLNPARRTLLAAVRSLSSNRATAAAALGLSKAQYFEVEHVIIHSALFGLLSFDPPVGPAGLAAF